VTCPICRARRELVAWSRHGITGNVCVVCAATIDTACAAAQERQLAEAEARAVENERHDNPQLHREKVREAQRRHRARRAA
jgi:hypothetical protein